MPGLSLEKQRFFDMIGYEPHDKQLEFHQSEARFKIAVCGRRYGKSTMAAREMAADLINPHKKGIYWIVGPTYDLAEKEFRVIYDDLMINQALLKDKSIRSSFNKDMGNMKIEFPWGTRLEVKSSDRPDGLVGEKLSGVIFSEAAKLRADVWEKFIQAALSDLKGYAIFTSTPEGQNWLYELYLLGLDPEEEDYESWQCPSWENSAVFPHGEQDREIKRLKRTAKSPELFAQEYAASFTTYAGQIYREFQTGTHVKEHTYNPAWPNYQFWDFGFVNALVALDVQVSPDDTVYIWREYYEPGVRLEDALAHFKARANPQGYKVDCCFADVADPEGIITINRMWAPCIGEKEAKDNWRRGVEVVKRFLAPRLKYDEFDEPVMEETPPVGLYVDPMCSNTIHEFINYKMATPPVKAIADAQEKPKKIHDHAMDAIRYGLMHLFELGGAHTHLSQVYSNMAILNPENFMADTTLSEDWRDELNWAHRQGDRIGSVFSQTSLDKMVF